MHRSPISAIASVGMVAAAMFLSARASAQTADPAQQRYEANVAACNAANLPAPQREACVRDVGAVLDRAPPAPAELTTPDGRATVLAPPGSSAAAGDTTVTTPDGRVTIIQPATP